MDWIIYIGAFIVSYVKEYLIVLYYLSISEGRAFLGSGLSLGIWLIDVLVIVSMVKIDLSLCLPYGVGTALGTYFCIKRNRS